MKHSLLYVQYVVIRFSAHFQEKGEEKKKSKNWVRWVRHMNPSIFFHPPSFLNVKA